MSLTLYVAEPSSVRFIGASPPSWMCALLLAEKQLDCEIVALDFARGEHRSSAMLARNPRGTIPVLCEGEAVVHETFAILEYLEWRAPGHLPEAAVARARALTRFHESEALKSAGMRALAYLMRHSPEQRDADTLREHGASLAAELARWQGYLEGRAWLVGEAPTLADFAVFPYLATLTQLGLPLGRWPALAAYAERWSARASVRASWPPGWGEPASTCPWPLPEAELP